MLGKKFGVQSANIVLPLTREIKFALLFRRKTFINLNWFVIIFGEFYP